MLRLFRRSHRRLPYLRRRSVNPWLIRTGSRRSSGTYTSSTSLTTSRTITRYSASRRCKGATTARSHGRSSLHRTRRPGRTLKLTGSKMSTTEMVSFEGAGVRAAGAWDVRRVREDFPVLTQTVNGKPLVYLDNAASSQVPRIVIERGSKYLREEHSNIHRGVHYLSQRATSAYEGAREKVKRFINAREARECILVRGVTEGINLVMNAYGRKVVREGDEIIVSEMEHHSNLVPWQMLCEEQGARLRVIPMSDAGELLLDEFDALPNEHTRLVCVGHVSNALGTINPIREITSRAHKLGVPVVVDGAQGAPHLKIDVQDLGCDFYAISGHKMFAPTGSSLASGARGS